MPLEGSNGDGIVPRLTAHKRTSLKCPGAPAPRQSV
jgi:hypothetical protein